MLFKDGIPSAHKIRLFLRSIVARWFKLESIYEHFFMDTFDASAVIVDLGAGKGEFASYMAKRYPNAKIVVLEANPFLAEKLTAMFNGNRNVIVTHAAIGGCSVPAATFYLSKDIAYSSLYESLSNIGGVNADGACAVTVNVYSLNDFFALHKIAKVDLLKVDVEGAEFEIFEKFSEHDFKCISQISIEFHDFLDISLRSRMQHCVHRLQTLGYACIHTGIDFMYGSQYFNCLFYDPKRLSSNSLTKYLRIPRWLYR